MRAGIVVMLLGSVVLTQAAQGQAPAPATLDAVPDKMPFDVPYGAPISLDRAQSVIAAAVDSGGSLVAFARMNGAQLASVSISEHKARAAAAFRRETKAYESGMQSGLVCQLSLDGVIGSRGGIPLVEDGKLIGAVRVSGGTGSQNEVSAKAGEAVVNK